jgi:hypothetical protein
MRYLIESGSRGLVRKHHYTYCNREADKRKQRSSKTEMENAYRGGRDLKLTYKA